MFSFTCTISLLYVMGSYFSVEQGQWWVQTLRLFLVVFFHRLMSSHFRDFFVCGKHRTHYRSLYNAFSSFLDGDLALSLPER